MRRKGKLAVVMAEKNKNKVSQGFTTHELAELLNVTPTTVIDWIRNGKIKCTRTLGGGKGKGHRRIPIEEYDRIVAQMQDTVDTPVQSDKPKVDKKKTPVNKTTNGKKKVPVKKTNSKVNKSKGEVNNTKTQSDKPKPQINKSVKTPDKSGKKQ